MKTWNYRILRFDDVNDNLEDTVSYDVFEVYYDVEGKPVACTEDGLGLRGASKQEVLDQLVHMTLDVDEYPSLVFEDFGPDAKMEGIR